MKGLETIVLHGLAKNPNLRVVDLQDNTATLRGARAVAEVLPQWTKLTELELSETLLRPRGGRMIIESLVASQLTGMTKIGLAFCDLGPDSLAALPKALRTMLTLEHLDVNGNFVEEDGPELEAIRQALEAIDREDALAEVDEMDPEGLEDLSEDEDISDHESEEEEEGEPTPAPTAAPKSAAHAALEPDQGVDDLITSTQGLSIGSGSQTIEFSLRGKGLRLDSEADVEPHLKELRELPNVKLIDLSGNTVGVEAAQALAQVIKTKTTLERINISDIFTGRLITEIPDALCALCSALAGLVPPHGNLEEVDLSDNAFGGRSVEPLVPLLEAAHALRALKLNNNGLGPEGGTVVANALARGAQQARAQGQASRLKLLVCGRNRLENGSSQAWAHAFAAHGALEEVRLYQNGIRMEGIETIVSRGLSVNTTLQVVDLQDNTATLRGAKAVAKALPYWHDLRELQLSETLLRPKGAALIIQALRKGNHAHLSKLGLAFCDIPARELSVLADTIQEQQWNLTAVDVNGNFAEEEGPELDALRQALSDPSILADADEMDPEGEEDLSDDEDVSDHGDDEQPAPAPEISKAVTPGPQ